MAPLCTSHLFLMARGLEILLTRIVYPYRVPSLLVRFPEKMDPHEYVVVIQAGAMDIATAKGFVRSLILSLKTGLEPPPFRPGVRLYHASW